MVRGPGEAWWEVLAAIGRGEECKGSCRQAERLHRLFLSGQCYRHITTVSFHPCPKLLGAPSPCRGPANVRLEGCDKAHIGTDSGGGCCLGLYPFACVSERAWDTPRGKTAARAAITPSPEPVSNITLSVAEDVLAIGLTWLATRHPYAAGTLAAILLGIIVILTRWVIRALIALFRGTEHELAA
jgi:hypothetical protein